MASSTYKPPAYDKKYESNVNTSYYDNAINAYKQQQETNRQQQIKDVATNRDAALRQAYVNKLQNQLQLKEQLAQSGIRGGATETSNLRLANQYGQARAAANSDYANSVTSINRGIDQNIADYTSDMKSRAEEYRQNQAQALWQADREAYSNQWQAQREDALRKEQYAREDKLTAQANAREDKATAYERQVAKENQQAEYWSSYYMNKFSGYTTKQLKAAEKEINALLKKATSATEKIRLQQALAGIGARRGVIKNK